MLSSGRWENERLSSPPQALTALYLTSVLAVFAVHPFWGYDISWDTPVGRWALRLQVDGNFFFNPAAPTPPIPPTHIPTLDPSLSPQGSGWVKGSGDANVITLNPSLSPQGSGWVKVSGDANVMVGLLLCPVAAAFLYVALCAHVYVATKRGRSLIRGEKLLLRVIEAGFFKVFGVPAVSALLAPAACDWTGRITGVAGANLFLPSHQCTSPGGAAFAVAGVLVCLCVHIPIHIALVLKDCELSPTTDVPLMSGSISIAARTETLSMFALVSQSDRQRGRWGLEQQPLEGWLNALPPSAPRRSPSTSLSAPVGRWQGGSPRWRGSGSRTFMSCGSPSSATATPSRELARPAHSSASSCLPRSSRLERRIRCPPSSSPLLPSPWRRAHSRAFACGELGGSLPSLPPSAT